MFGRGLNLQPPVLRAGPSLAPARPMPQIVMPRR
jgi:hypothetical protein